MSDKFPLVNRMLHGSSGPVESRSFPLELSIFAYHAFVSVGHFGYHSEIASKFIRSCVSTGIPYVKDVNTSGGTLGVTKVRLRLLVYCLNLKGL